jgi:hypothetical protein
MTISPGVSPRPVEESSSTDLQRGGPSIPILILFGVHDKAIEPLWPDDTTTVEVGAQVPGRPWHRGMYDGNPKTIADVIHTVVDRHKLNASSQTVWATLVFTNDSSAHVTCKELYDVLDRLCEEYLDKCVAMTSGASRAGRVPTTREGSSNAAAMLIPTEASAFVAGSCATLRVSLATVRGH